MRSGVVRHLAPIVTRVRANRGERALEGALAAATSSEGGVLRILSRAALIALALLACALPAQAMAKGTGLEAYEVKATAKNLRTLGSAGL